MMVIVASPCFAQRLRLGAGAGAATALAILPANAAETPAAVARSMNSRRLMKPWRKSTMASSRSRLRSAKVSLRSLIARRLLPGCDPTPAEIGGCHERPRAIDRNRRWNLQQAAKSRPLVHGAILRWVAPLTIHSRCESMVHSGACQLAPRSWCSVPSRDGSEDRSYKPYGGPRRPLPCGHRHRRHLYRSGCLRHRFGDALDLQDAIGAESAGSGAARCRSGRGSGNERYRRSRPRHDGRHERADRADWGASAPVGHRGARGHPLYPAHQPQDALRLALAETETAPSLAT